MILKPEDIKRVGFSSWEALDIAASLTMAAERQLLVKIKAIGSCADVLWRAPKEVRELKLRGWIEPEEYLSAIACTHGVRLNA